MIWRVTSVALFGLAAIGDPVTSVTAGLAGAGLLVFAFIRPDLAVDPDPVRWPVALLTLALVLVGSRRGSFAYPDPAELISIVWITGAVAAAALIAARRQSIQRLAMALGLVLIVALSIGTVLQFHGNLFGLDVYRSHEAAADALASGKNPYTDAVKVLDGSPNATEGAVIEGYAYPPVTLVLFSVSDWLGGDPRWAAALAVVGALLLLLRASAVSVGGTSVVVLLAATPTLRSMVWSGATEPVTLALLVIAAVSWRRWMLSAVVLGLALATKQYLVLLVPLLFLLEGRPWRRTAVAAIVAGTTLLPAFVVDPGAFWFTLVERPLSLGFRPDTQSLSGALAQIGWMVEVPAVVMAVVVLGVSWALARAFPQRGGAEFLGGSAVVLSVVFVLSLAFTNYWWLAQWMAAASTLVAIREQRETAGDGFLNRADAA